MLYIGNNPYESIKGEDRISRQYSEDGSFELTRDNQTGQEKHIVYSGERK